MNNVRIMIIFLTNLIGLSNAWSTEVVVLSADKSYWQCSVQDNDNKQWIAHSQYELSATNKALEACKKQSILPESCKVGNGSCTGIVKGAKTNPMWQCTALDQMAKPWPSNFYSQRDAAALAAKDQCQQHSSMPDSCYINLLTCNNRNGLH